LAVWMPSKAWLKQNWPPATMAPVASEAKPQLFGASCEPMNMYSTLALQLTPHANSTPPPAVQVVTVSLEKVLMLKLPQPCSTWKQASMTDALTGTKATPPLP